MELEPITGTPVRLPPGRVAIRLDERYRLPYRRLYDRYESYLSGLPVLRDRDFTGRRVLVTPAQLEALNAGLRKLAQENGAAPPTPFGQQERAKKRLFKRLQFLS